MNYKEVDGDLIKLAEAGELDVIAHGCNCMCVMASGLAPQMAKAFGCNQYPKEAPVFKGDINKLGTIDIGTAYVKPGDKKPLVAYTSHTMNNTLLKDGYTMLDVVNCYSQYSYNVAEKPLDYAALELCFKKMNHIFHGKHIGLPEIGCHLAGGDWKVVEKMIKNIFTKCPVTVVHYKP